MGSDRDDSNPTAAFVQVMGVANDGNRVRTDVQCDRVSAVRLALG